MSAADKKGLPGFLRRSLRIDDSYDEEQQSSDDCDGEFKEDTHRNNNGVGTAAAAAKKETSASAAAAAHIQEETEDESTADDSSSVAVAAADSVQKTAFIQPPPICLPSTKSLKRTVSYKEAVFEKTIMADVVNMADLRRLSWNGIPHTYRGMAWKCMLGYLPTNSVRRESTLMRKRQEYRESKKSHYDMNDDSRTLQEQETLRQVLVDVPRTAPNVALFRNERIKQSLTRLLYIWAMRHPASSYVQGINDLATPLIVVFLSDYFEHASMDSIMDGSVMEDVSHDMMQEIEADCYWCLTNLLAGIQDHYTSDQPGVQRMVMRLEELVTRIDADLVRHLKEVGIEFLQFSFKWMNCLLLREFNLKCVCRLWDTYIAEDGFEDFHVYVCAAFLCQFSSQLQNMEFDELFGFMQHIPTDDWGDTEVEILLSQAFVLSTLFGGSDAHLVAGSQQTNRS